MDKTIATLGTNQSGMRAFNEKLVLTILRKKGAMAKTEIAKLTGLSAQTVSVIMRSLEEEGLLIKGEPQRGKVGQPSVPMSLNPEGAYFYGLKIGRRSAEFVLTDFMGKILGHERFFYPYPVADKIVEFTQSAYENLNAKAPLSAQGRVAGLGVAMPFELWNWAQLIGVDPEAMAHWRDTDIASVLGAHFDLPIYLQNDATSACGAELVFGEPEHRPANFLYFYVGYFIGGGVVLDNRLFSGPSGYAGALGPMIVEDQNGQAVSLLDTSSIAVFENMLQARGMDSEFIWEADSDWSGHEEILQKWLEGNAHGLAQAIHSAISVIDFEAAMIDGWLPEHLCAALVEKTREEFEKLSAVGLTTPSIQRGSVGRNARVLGAASLPLAENFMIDF